MTPGNAQSSLDHKADVVIIGGGIVGLATALAISDAHPSLKLTLLEKEAQVATHQTGHNSGVIHSGIYYQPGSFKAHLCVEGARDMIGFCAQHQICVDHIGKVIVATSESELGPLQELERRAIANGVRVERIDVPRLHQIEPNAAGIAALHSPDTAIVDYGEVSRKIAQVLIDRGVRVRKMSCVIGIDARSDSLTIRTDREQFHTARMINCAGLHCDTIARMMDLEPQLRIIPFRGEYYMFKPSSANLIKGLIYPVPNPDLPFLGVHFTRTVHGEVEAGPNAVLALAREGYTWGDVRPGHMAQTLAYPGFWKMSRKFWRTGVYEMYRSLSKRAFVRALQKLVPGVKSDDLVPGHAGVRAQAVDDDGKLIQDFRFVSTPLSLHVLNAPSPAATASLALGKHIAGEASRMLGDTSGTMSPAVRRI